MTNYFASSLLDAMGKVLHLHTGTCQYPPDKQAKATELVLEQAEVLCREWSE